MRLTNDCYLITLQAGSGVEHYYRDGPAWVKRSTRGRKFKATSEQVLNHLLPALAGVSPRVFVKVEHRDLSASAGQVLDGLREASTERRLAARAARSMGPTLTDHAPQSPDRSPGHGADAG